MTQAKNGIGWRAHGLAPLAASIVLTALFVGPAPARAQSTLDLPLNTGETKAPSATAPQASSPQTKPAAKSTPDRSGNVKRGLPALPSRGGSGRFTFRQDAMPAPKTVQARVGVIRVAKAEIRATIAADSRLLSEVSEGTNLAVLSETPTHYGVLMVNNALGWIPKDALGLIDYTAEVTLTQTPSETGGEPAPSGLPARTEGLLREAFSYLGVPYVWAGNTRSGLDCSAFVKNVFRSAGGVELPRHSGDQARVGSPVSELQPGDRLYFAMKGGRVDHCGIYIGNGYFIHASSNHGKVAVDKIAGSRYYQKLVAARRS